MSQLPYDEVLKGPVEYAISLILRNNVYQFQLRDKRNNKSPVLAFRNRLSYHVRLSDPGSYYKSYSMSHT